MSLQDWLQSFFGKAGAAQADRQQSAQIKRADRFAKAWNAYYGRFPDSLAIKPGKPNDNVKLNFARLVVDQGVDFLFGKDLMFEIDELNNTQAEIWLEKFWQANQKMTFLQKLAVNGGVCGQAFVKITEGGEYPRLIVLDPGIVDVVSEPGDYEMVREYVITYPAGTAARRQVIRRAVDSWEIIDQEKGPLENEWQTVTVTVWPRTWPPILYCQNLPTPNEFWGMSDIEEDFIRLNESINFVLSNTARIIRYHAHPKTWVRGALGLDSFKIGADETILLPDGAEMRNLEMTDDLGSSIELYKRLKEALHETARNPEVASGKLESTSNISGVALQILHQPLLSKTYSKRRSYGGLLVELNRRLLELGGFGSENYIKIHWPEILPRDMLQERQAALIDLQLGVSQDTVLRRIDFDPHLEREKKAEEVGSLGDSLLAQFEQGKQ